MRLAVAVAIAVSLIGVSAPSSNSQTARQGPAPAGERFRSPMIVETPLTPFEDVSQRGAASRALADTTELSRFVCDGISVARLSAKASDKLDGEHRRSLEISLTLASARHEDKDIGVTVELVRDGRVVASSQLPSVEVEEGSRATRQVKWRVASDEVDSKPAGLIRVTVTVPGGDNLSVPPPAFVAAPPVTAPAPAAAQTTDAPATEASPTAATTDSPTARPESAPPPPAGIDPATCRTLISEADFDKTYFVTLKEISVSKKFYGSVEEMYVPLAEKARKAGADGVINVHLWHAASGFAWAAPHAGGMAVKWTEAGRKALHGFPGRCY